MLKIIQLIILIASCNIALIGQEKSVDIKNLTSVLTEFEQAISEKDSIRFNKLLFNDEIPFVGIMSKETEFSIKKDYPEFQGIAVSTSRKFIADICKSDKQQTEKFYNIQIDTDGSIASISFDYSFLSGDKMIQWGNEKWNLVFVEDNWLITDVVYSIHFPKVEPFPYK